tara:strand:+ start:5427 stop:17480 length:12054 start_codon:yes stop_codon:yes gene_type:complete
MAIDRVNIQDIISSQVPAYVRDDFPLLVEFLNQYYLSVEFQSGTYDLITNIDKYVKVDELYGLVDSTILQSDILSVDTTIDADINGNFTEGFPKRNGLLLIDDEIISYTHKTDTSFEGCIRGFSGITSYSGTNTPDQLVFKETLAADHTKNTVIYNLSIRFLKEFFRKLKNQVIPGFEDRAITKDVDARNFIFGSRSFYESKGTDDSIEILFRALYGKDSSVIRPSEYLFKPSDADYRVSIDMVVEKNIGDPLELKGRTIYQDSRKARGSVCNVEKLNWDYASLGIDEGAFNTKSEYYQVSIDYGYQRDIDVSGTVFSTFEPAAKTQLVNTAGIGATIIDVDSTVSFGSTGEIILKDADYNDVVVQYTSKSLNQFIGITTLTVEIPNTSNVVENDFAYSYIGKTESDIVNVRITGALKDFNVFGDTYSLNANDTISVKTLGYPSSSFKENNWLFNVKTNWNVKNITLIDASESTYKVELHSNHFFYIGYKVRLIGSNGTIREGYITAINTNKGFVAKLSSSIPESELSLRYNLKNIIQKGLSNNYPIIQKYYSNIQNVYTKFNGDLLISSNSIPSYLETILNPYSKEITFSGSATGLGVLNLQSSGDHGLYTGDAVFYKGSVTETITNTPDGNQITTKTKSQFSNLDELVYFVKRVSSTQIQLAKSKSDLFSNKYVVPIGSVENNKIILYSNYGKQLLPQHILRQVLPPDNKSGTFFTQPGPTGIFINGVEVFNFKSPKRVYYGKINNFEVVDKGYGYDVINPPELLVTDSKGSGAVGNVSVNGSLERIDIIDTGYDYIDTPIIEIKGGGGQDAAAKVNVSSVAHVVTFNAGAGSTNVNTTDSTIGFSTFHKFRDFEKLVYKTGGSNTILGLSTNSVYYANVVDAYTVKLHNTLSESKSGINTVTILSKGKDTQSLETLERKRLVTDVIVTNSGFGYKNKKRTIPSSGINTSTDNFIIPNHGYMEGDIIRYTPGSSPVSGISSNTDYYVTRVDDDKFLLSGIGTGSIAKDYYYSNNVYINITSSGNGSFNYEPISVNISGTIGVNTLTNQDFNCKIKPVFRGNIESIDTISGGVGYGASTTMDFNRQPNISLVSGSDGQLFPVIANGKIIDVVVQSGGSGYNSPPDLVLSGSGDYAKLTPVIVDGKITEVKIINGGAGYVQGDIQIKIVKSGNDCSIKANIQQWVVDIFANDFNNIKDDDGFVIKNTKDDSLQYAHIYAPRKLRESLYSVDSNGNKIYGNTDLVTNNGIEIESLDHSPIIGWAYDGNPIYGPYGYTNAFGGTVTRIKSSYELVTQQSQRPPLSSFGEGFFVEDYQFTGSGDLDEHNGRICVTPEYPNGTYAYFATIKQNIDNFGPFDNYKRPEFPYIIGPTFKSKPNSFNFLKTSNQSDYDLKSNKWLRNTTPYNLNNQYSSYDYILNSSKDKPQKINITAATTGKVESIGISTGGDNYKVNDKIDFDSVRFGKNARASVDRVSGRKINTVSIATTQISEVEFVPQTSKSQFLGVSSTPHGFNDKDIVTVNGLSRYFDGLDGRFTVGVTTSRLSLAQEVGLQGSTGIHTYISVSGNLSYPTIMVDDILKIGTEKVKVLKIEPGRLRVERAVNSTVAIAHTISSIIEDDSRRFSIKVGSSKTTQTLTLNKKIYFEPSESVGVGTVGIGNTLSIVNPGAGITQIFVDPRNIYLPNHGLKLNEILKYNPNDGTSIQVWSGLVGVAYTNLSSYDKLYAVPLNNRYVGISSNKVGLGTTGTYVGINTDTNLLYFTGIGTGNNHSFHTDKNNVVTGNVSKNIVTVSTAGTHGLAYKNKIFFDLNPTNQIDVIVKYDDYNRRIVFDPTNFIASDVDIDENTIKFSSMPFKTGDKVIYTASSPASGLTNNGMYYVYIYTVNKIKLVSEKNELKSLNPKFVDITSSSNGTLSRINPFVEVSRNNILKFDLSDSSLSSISNGVSYSAFDMKIYTDLHFNNRFITSGKGEQFEVTTNGRMGLDSDASLSINFTNNVPSVLWYDFEPIKKSSTTTTKTTIVVDKDAYAFSEINVVRTKLDGPRDVTSIGSTTFTFNIASAPNIISFGSSNCNATYETTSKTAQGAISKVKILDPGSGYKSIPSISSITSGFGTGAYLEPDSNSIGILLKSDFNSSNIGYDYPTDPTLRVLAGVPEVIKLSPLSSFQSIGITSSGINYLVSPDLIVIDGSSGKVVEVDLEYDLGDTEVKILKNTSSLYDIPPTIIPINNSNGFSISSITYNNSTKIVRLFLPHQFSGGDFPFEVGKSIMVENISIGSTGSGFNSKDYNYALFSVSGVNAAAGGSGAWVEYDLNQYVGKGYPGNYSSDSLGRVIPKVNFPIFDSQIRKNDFLKGERFEGPSYKGRVDSYNNNIEIIKAKIDGVAQPGDIIRGATSGAEGAIEFISVFDAEITIGTGTTITEGWQKNTGFLNDNLQRLPDNEYYQNLSYSISSEVDFDTWSDPVNSLVHTSGFKKYADLQILSGEVNDDLTLTVSSPDSNIETIVDIVSSADLNCYYDFDSAIERTRRLGNVDISDEIVLDTRILSDYFQSVGNRVLSIDDISPQFNSNERTTPFEVISIFGNDFKYNKLITHVRDRVFTDERQFAIVSCLQNNNIGYINQFASIESYPYLGYYDYASGSDGWRLLFYPTKFEFNTYDVSTANFSILTGISTEGSKGFGDVAFIKSEITTIPASTNTDIISIGATYRSAKVMANFEASDNTMFISELNLVHDGTDVYQLELGSIDENEGVTGVGFGTFDSRLSGGNIIVKFFPNGSLAMTCNASVIAISDAGTTVSNTLLDVTRVGSSYATIASSGSPTANVVASYEDPSESAYYFMTIEDNTNNKYEILEFGALNSSTNDVYVEWGNINTGGTIGTVGVAASTSGLQIVYTPEPNIDVDVRTYFTEMIIYDDNVRNDEIDISNTIIKTDHKDYEGTKLDLKTKFDLKHDGLDIFRRVFDGSSAATVDVSKNKIIMPNHYFVSGEGIEYSHPGTGTTMAIVIDNTTFPSIGATTKLPNTELFVIKIDEASIQLATSAENALSTPPVPVGISAVGAGASHAFNSTNQNAKGVIAIDNMIQSPLAVTDITTTLDQNITFDLVFNTTGVTSFISGDVIKIDDEYMILKTIGVGNTIKVSVSRGDFGSTVAIHTTGSTITKYDGNYNIINNQLFFGVAPTGHSPLSTTTGDPNSRDWTGITTSSNFHGRTFMKNAGTGTTNETYYQNYVFDSISDRFTGIGQTYRITSNNSNITGISSSSVVIVNGIHQTPQGVQAHKGDYNIIEDLPTGISSISFTGNANSLGYDYNKSTLPAGGQFISLGSTGGFGYQPLVSAAGTALVSAAGTIASISIGNSGSGYRSGIQTVVNVGVQTYSGVIANVEFVGTANISGGNIVSVAITNPGAGYTFTNAPVVVFDEPLSYVDIPLIFSSSSPSGIGRSATANIIVGQGSSVIDFEIRDSGYGYREGEILTVALGGSTGIPTDTTKTFDEFQINVDRVHTDAFAGWSIGQFQVFDVLDDQFDGSTKAFKLKVNEETVAIQSKKGSNIELDQTLLVFINDILQKPGEAYVFDGGSVITFSEAPKGPLVGYGNTGDTSKILFYRGSGDTDVIFTNIEETVKVGDLLKLSNNPDLNQSITLDQKPRTVIGINTLDSVSTNSYIGPGVTTDQTLYRPVNWYKQKIDKVVDGDEIGKDRLAYEPSIFPAAYLTQPLSISTTIVYVDTVRPIFDSRNESNLRSFQNSIVVNTQDVLVGASVTAVVSIAGTISSFVISNSGQGYVGLSTIAISVAPPIGLGNTHRASGVGSMSSGKLVTASVNTIGSGYTYTNPPAVIIEEPILVEEIMPVTSYNGDYGNIVGFGTTTSGSFNQLRFDLYIPSDSDMRKSDIVGTAVTVSGISTGDYFTVFNSNISPAVGSALTSLYNDGTTLGITTSFMDGVFQVYSSSTVQVDVLGVGTTAVRRLFTNVGSISTVSYGTTSFGSFSWGKIGVSRSSISTTFSSYNENGYSGISTSALVTRRDSLRFINYI